MRRRFVNLSSVLALATVTVLVSENPASAYVVDDTPLGTGFTYNIGGLTSMGLPANGGPQGGTNTPALALDQRSLVYNGLEVIWNGTGSGVIWNGTPIEGVIWNGFEGVIWNGTNYEGVIWNGAGSGVIWNGAGSGVIWNGTNYEGVIWNGVDNNGVIWNGAGGDGVIWNSLVLEDSRKTVNGDNDNDPSVRMMVPFMNALAAQSLPAALNRNDVKRALGLMPYAYPAPESENQTARAYVPDAFAKANTQLVQYLWKCAMPEGSNGSIGENPLTGNIGIAPEWQSGACGVDCQHWVSACLLAHVNAYGTQVQVSLCAETSNPDGRGKLPQCTNGPVDINDEFTVPEGRFFGNLFTSDERLLHKGVTCSEDIAANQSTIPGYKTARWCTLSPSSCGMVDGAEGGKCSDIPRGAQGAISVPLTVDGINGNGQTAVTQIIHSYLRPPPVPVCGNDKCEEGETNCSDCGTERVAVDLGNSSTKHQQQSQLVDVKPYDKTGRVVYLSSMTKEAVLPGVSLTAQPAAISDNDLLFVVRHKDDVLQTKRAVIPAAAKAKAMVVGDNYVIVHGKGFLARYDKTSLTQQWLVSSSTASFDYAWIDPNKSTLHITGKEGNVFTHWKYLVTNGALDTSETFAGSPPVLCQSPVDGSVFTVLPANGGSTTLTAARTGASSWSTTPAVTGAQGTPAPTACRVTQDGSKVIVVGTVGGDKTSFMMSLDAATGGTNWSNWIPLANQQVDRFLVSKVADTVDQRIILGGSLKGGTTQQPIKANGALENTCGGARPLTGTGRSFDTFAAAYNVNTGCVEWVELQGGSGDDVLSVLTVDSEQRVWIGGSYTGKPLLAGEYVDNSDSDIKGVHSMLLGVGPIAPDTWAGGACTVNRRKFADFDNNGMSDLFWHHIHGTSSVWTMNGASPGGGFPGTNIIPNPNWPTVSDGGYITPFQDDAWQLVGDRGDYNGDGKSDLVWWNVNTNSAKITLMDGPNVLSEGNIAYAQGIDPDWKIFDTASDCNGDGRSDLVWWHPTLHHVFVALHDGANFSNSQYVYQSITAWELVSAGGDYNGDGKSDLLFYNPSTRSVWTTLMNGSQILQGATTFEGTDPGWTIVDGKGDYDGDGKSDVLWNKASTGDMWWFRMNGTSLYSDSGALETLPSSSWRVVDGSSDFNGDCKADIVFKNTTNNDVKIWIMDGASHTTTDYPAASTWQFGPLQDFLLESGASDVNGDGKADLVGIQSSSSATTILQMNGSTIAGLGGTYKLGCDWHEGATTSEVAYECVAFSGQDAAYWDAQPSWPNGLKKATASIYDVMGVGDTSAGSALIAMQASISTTSRLLAAMLNAQSDSHYMLSPDLVRVLWNNPTHFPAGYPTLDSYLESTWAY